MLSFAVQRRLMQHFKATYWTLFRSKSSGAGIQEEVDASSGALYECASPDLEILARREMLVIEDFVSKIEEEALLGDIEPKWRRLRYQFDHWDNAIQGYREKEISTWSDKSLEILQRVRQAAFSESDKQRGLVHVLDLAEDGFIKPHVDSIKFCGRVIAGLSLLSPSVMRLVHEKDGSKFFSALLRRRSLYIMKDSVCHDFTHEILKNDCSSFAGEKVHKGRRISVICRSDPDSCMQQNYDDLFKSKVVSLEPE